MLAIVAYGLNLGGMHPSASYTLTLAFAAFLLASLGARFWLASRQIRHVARNRDRVPPAFAATVTLPAHQKAADYTVAKTRFGLLEMAFGAAVLLAWTLLGGLDALNQALLRWIGPGMAQQLALLASFALIGGAAELPFTLYQTFVIEERFGFNKMTLKLWLADLLKTAVLGAAIGLPIAALILWLMGAAGNLWWLWAWGVWMGFNLLLLVVYPTFIAPLFNRFEPLADESLIARVQALMQRCGFRARGFFVMDGSKRSAHANAYFTGFGTAKRVVFYDTLLQRLDGDEVEAVLAHELGHFHHRHIVKRLVVFFAFSLAGFALLGWLANQVAFYAGLNVMINALVPNDALALLLFMIAVPPFLYFVSPAFAAMSRRAEFEADAFARSNASAGDLAHALLKLHEDNASTLTPDPLYVRFYYSHPPAAARIAALGVAA
jgi:STE24 endopeptidase